MTERRRYGLVPTPGTEKVWLPKPELKQQVQARLAETALSLADLPTHVPPPSDGSSGSW